MFASTKDAVLELVKRQTVLGISKLPKGSPAARTAKKTDALSEKGEKARQIIENEDFGCQKESVAKLVSIILGEEIDVSSDDDIDFDEGREIKVPDFSLLVCMHDKEDDQSTDIEKGGIILNMGQSSDEYGETVEEMVKAQGKAYLDDEGEYRYDFQSIYENSFRFATPEEIEKYLKSKPARFYSYWFKQFGVILNMIKDE